MSELKAVLDMTTTHIHTCQKMPTPLTHSCSNDGVIQLGSLSSDTMFEVVKISDAGFVHLLLQDVPHAVRSLSACVKVGGGHLKHLLLILTFKQLSVDIPV